MKFMIYGKYCMIRLKKGDMMNDNFRMKPGLLSICYDCKKYDECLKLLNEGNQFRCAMDKNLVVG